MTKLSATLSVNSIDQLIQDIGKYQRELQQKCATFCSRLSIIGMNVISAKIAESRGDSDKDYSAAFYTDAIGVVTHGYLKLTGSDILFIEFGSGIYYNNGAGHPKAGEFGYGVGTYPSEEVYGHRNQAITPGYWWYRDDSDELHFSLGTEATMPMFNASLEMIKQIRVVAREVFG